MSLGSASVLSGKQRISICFGFSMVFILPCVLFSEGTIDGNVALRGIVLNSAPGL